jgi:acyl carrier protein
MGRYTTRLASLSPDRRAALADAVRKSADVSGARLVAYIVPRGAAIPDATSLRAHCRRELPEYMVPSIYVPIDAVPISPTGKLDRSALPDPVAAIPSPPASGQPQGSMEETLAAVWCEVLSLPSVGRDDDFFADLGGHSLLAARLLAAIRERLVVPLQLRDLFEQSTIARLARTIERSSETKGDPHFVEPAIGRRPREAHRSPLEETDESQSR